AIYNAGMGYFNRVALVTGSGTSVGDGREVPTPEAVAASMDEITSLDGGQEFRDARGAFSPMMETLGPKKEGGEPETGGRLTVAEVFSRIPQAFQAEKAAGVDVVFQF
ncbi:MAG: short-chain dehydrogenase, partial [Proteobacteria bacterium]|nr:short-chain dehydrogenase [Pseudomonadota bacterium]